MKISIDCTTGHSEDFASELRIKGSKALDKAWERPVIKTALEGINTDEMKLIKSHGDKIRAFPGKTVVLCNTTETPLIKALDSLDFVRETNKTIIFEESLSPKYFESKIEELEKIDFFLLVLSSKKETVEAIAAYACLKKMLIGKYGTEEAGKRITFFVQEESEFFAEQGKTDELDIVVDKSWIEEKSLLNLGVLLYMYVAGYNLETVISNCYELVASPLWDAQGLDYTMLRKLYIEEQKRCESLCYLHYEMEYICNLHKETQWQGFAQVKKMQTDTVLPPNSFATVFHTKKSKNDIMLPNFIGNNEDGSLNGLANEKREELVNSLSEVGIPSINITVDELNEETLVQLIYFINVSKHIGELCV